MQLRVLSFNSDDVSTREVSDNVFGASFNEPLVHQIIVAYQANARLATRAQKGRSEIAKSTRKPWRQKGTGRARAGMASSPIWRGGGKIFPNSPDEDFSQKVNKKMYRAGLRSIYAQLAREGRLVILDGLKLDAPKTSAFKKGLPKGLGSLLIICDQVEDNLHLASRNLESVEISRVSSVNPCDLLKSDTVAIDSAALTKIEGWLQ